MWRLPSLTHSNGPAAHRTWRKLLFPALADFILISALWKQWWQPCSPLKLNIIDLFLLFETTLSHGYGHLLVPLLSHCLLILRLSLWGAAGLSSVAAALTYYFLSRPPHHLLFKLPTFHYNTYISNREAEPADEIFNKHLSWCWEMKYWEGKLSWEQSINKSWWR